MYTVSDTSQPSHVWMWEHMASSRNSQSALDEHPQCRQQQGVEFKPYQIDIIYIDTQTVIGPTSCKGHESRKGEERDKYIPILMQKSYSF